MSAPRYPSAVEAEAAFYAAFEAADVDAMLAVWDDAPDALCVHPLGPVLVGIRAIAESWRELFSNGPGMRFDVRPHNVVETTGLAVRTVAEVIHVAGEAASRPPILATNAYRLTPSGWRIIVHHASPSAEHGTRKVVHVRKTVH